MTWPKTGKMQNKAYKYRNKNDNDRGASNELGGATSTGGPGTARSNSQNG